MVVNAIKKSKTGLKRGDGEVLGCVRSVVMNTVVRELFTEKWSKMEGGERGYLSKEISRQKEE